MFTRWVAFGRGLGLRVLGYFSSYHCGSTSFGYILCLGKLRCLKDGRICRDHFWGDCPPLEINEELLKKREWGPTRESYLGYLSLDSPGCWLDLAAWKVTAPSSHRGSIFCLSGIRPDWRGISQKFFISLFHNLVRLWWLIVSFNLSKEGKRSSANKR